MSRQKDKSFNYYKDKGEIINQILEDGYRKILQVVQSFQSGEQGLEEQIRDSLENYIRTALAFPEEYKSFLLSSEPAILAMTGILERGTIQKRQTLRMLSSTLEKGMKLGLFKEQDPELTAQIFWTATFGLITRLTVEKDIPKEQVDRLIRQHFTILLQGIRKHSGG